MEKKKECTYVPTILYLYYIFIISIINDSKDESKDRTRLYTIPQ